MDMEQQEMEQPQASPEASPQPESPEPQGNSPSDDPVSEALEALGEPEDGDVAGQEESAEDEPSGEEQGEASGEEGGDGDELTPPEGLSERAAERFQKLANEVKELRAQVESERERAEQVVSVLKETGATPEELGQTFEFVRLAKAGDRESLKRAAAIARDWLKQVSVALGEEIAVDPLSGHDDLTSRIEAGELSREDAMEIARAREFERQMQQRAQSMSAEQQQMLAAQQAVQQAVAEVEALETEWAKSDPEWSLKQDMLMRRIEEIARTMPPQAWPNAVRLAYEAVNEALEQAKKRQAAPIMAAGSRPTASRTEPDNAVDAALAALNEEV